MLVRHNVNSPVITGIKSRIPNLFIDSSLSRGVCPHQYLNKWDGEYVCMDCNQKLQDTDRIMSETELEASTPADTIPVDITVGKMSQMRGVSIAFLLAFTAKFDCRDKSYGGSSEISSNL